MIPILPAQLVRDIVRRAFQEDISGAGDITSLCVIPEGATGEFEIRARANGVVCGMQAAIEAFTQAGPGLSLDVLASDGDPVEPGESILGVSGHVRDIMLAERTALNFLGRMSGIATLTRRYVDAVVGTKAKIVHTRKTTPGLRALEIQAVRAGGGSAHRYNLSDAILIKDNHIAAAGSPASAVRAARAEAGHMVRISCEIDRLEDLSSVMKAGADVVLLDNFSLDDLRAAAVQAAGRITLEASGGVTLDSVADIAATGVDIISVGALTHSAPNFDFGLDAA
ncbi:carboxylating nicotinate-nucleotide diphosphorylase [Hyphobacterium sp. HN65]|uniref:nicotinate-nucleotide diphosphorylase (carboxylating) n=1 Tax=Hyphobacterium lacteum TaxID=3116575 RepID=A0ABU7LMY6_9PROT|nr:carboxylating nicotinate-nucleotide diphosphorylase [Hyphobacterium sp. HN65]MEE2525259.1 carboxylating nicotinate-nucleotide diphosphorylase [Hyphobacterium sp. HN65]